MGTSWPGSLVGCRGQELGPQPAWAESQLQKERDNGALGLQRCTSHIKPSQGPPGSLTFMFTKRRTSAPHRTAFSLSKNVLAPAFSWGFLQQSLAK